MKCFLWGPYLHTQLFDEGKREENVGGLIGLHRSRQMAKEKSKSGSRVKHMNKGQFGKKKRIQVAYLGFVHIWVLAFGNKYYLRVCYDPQFIVTKRLWNLRLLFNFWGNPLWVQPKARLGVWELTSPPLLSLTILLRIMKSGMNFLQTKLKP